MKDFIKTNEFVRNVNAFSELLMHLWWYSKDGRTMQIGETLDTLRDLRIKTRLKGEVLAKEVLEVCPDMKDLQYYFDQWTKRLDLIDTHFIYIRIMNLTLNLVAGLMMSKHIFPCRESYGA